MVLEMLMLILAVLEIATVLAVPAAAACLVPTLSEALIVEVQAAAATMPQGRQNHNHSKLVSYI